MKNKDKVASLLKPIFESLSNPIETFHPKLNQTEIIGKAISEIINQDGENKTDGQVIDEIIELLNFYKLYTPKK